MNVDLLLVTILQRVPHRHRMSLKILSLMAFTVSVCRVFGEMRKGAVALYKVLEAT